MSAINKKFVILISGPTGVGKSNIVQCIADEYGQNVLGSSIEVVNADIGSFYTHLTIGTAKPDWQNQSVPHHFFDVIDTTASWTAPQFREKLETLVQEIWSRGNIPVVVGGSAFYIQAFFYKNHTMTLPSEDLIISLESQEPSELWEQLHQIDPQRAQKIEVNDHYRLVRALAIWHTQGQAPSDFQPIFNPIAPFYFITLTRDRDQLYQMIDQRVHQMMEAGWLDEVRSLIDDEEWVDFLLKKKMIGYDLLAGYLLGYQSEQSLEEITGLIAQRTRNYAKRQITFLKKLQKNIKESIVTSQQYAHWDYKVQEFNVSMSSLDVIVQSVIVMMRSI